MNENLVGKVELDGDSGNDYKLVIIPVPEYELGTQNLTVKLAAYDNRLTMQLIEVRLISEDIK